MTGYAVVSCHAERPLDDRVWERYERLLQRRPGGFSVTSFLRPPATGEDPQRWLEPRAPRCRADAAWTSHALGRPVAGPAARRRRSGRRCAGGGRVAPFERPRAGLLLRRRLVPRRRSRTHAGRVRLHRLHRHDLPSDLSAVRGRPAAARRPAPGRPGGRGELLELPATHSLGALARGLLRLPAFVHVHFHDWELVQPARRHAIYALLRALARVRRPLSIAALAERSADAPEVGWDEATIAS